jgi:hypothetical protein
VQVPNSQFFQKSVRRWRGAEQSSERLKRLKRGDAPREAVQAIEILKNRWLFFHQNLSLTFCNNVRARCVMSMEVWLAFFAACWVISLSPGAGAIASMSSGLQYGFWRGYWNALGLQLGLILQIAIIAAGVGAILAPRPPRSSSSNGLASPTWFTWRTSSGVPCRWT